MTRLAGSFIIRPSCTSDPMDYVMVGKAVFADGFRTADRSQWNCSCWKPHNKYEQRFILLGFELSDEQALRLGAAHNIGNHRTALSHASMPFPTAGELVTDVSATKWRVDQAIQPFQQDCETHGSIDVAEFVENALQVSLESQCGAYVTVNK